MSVVVSMQDVGPWRKQLTVEVPAPAVEAETQRVVREYSQRVRVPGFRRGKVPAELVRRRFAKDIEREVVDRLLPRYWRQAQAESEIVPLLPPEVDEVRDIEAGGPLTFVATVETRPTIELRNIRDFDLPDPGIEPGELDVDKALDDLRTRFGEWVPVERTAARGDLVNAEITETTEPSTAPGVSDASAAAPVAKTEPVEFEVGDPRVWEELSLAVSGLGAGQEESFTREALPEATDAPEPEGGAATPRRQRRFKVRVSAVKERELPALDDELAARINPELGGLAALREMVSRRLRETRIEERAERRQRALLDQLRERHPMELPQGVVQREAESIAQGLERRGLKPEQVGLDWQRIREEAERRVHAELLLDAIAEAESVTVSDEEFERTLAALARAQKTTTPAMRKALDEHGRLETLRDQMRRDKTVRHLLGEAVAETAHFDGDGDGDGADSDGDTEPHSHAAAGDAAGQDTEG
jgi:trigger factor